MAKYGKFINNPSAFEKDIDLARNIVRVNFRWFAGFNDSLDGYVLKTELTPAKRKLFSKIEKKKDANSVKVTISKRKLTQLKEKYHYLD